jgi:hypothetical protein
MVSSKSIGKVQELKDMAGPSDIFSFMLHIYSCLKNKIPLGSNIFIN